MKNFQITLIFILLITGVKGQIIEPYFIKNLNVTVRPLKNINTETSEISPVIIKNKLFYSSIPAANFVEWRLKRNIAYYETYDAGYLPGSNDIVTPSLLIEGEKSYNVGPVAWCEKTQELFVSLTNEIDLEAVSKLSREANSRLKLVIMKESGGKWKITEELAFNDEEYNYAHPAISVTGDTLIFISDLNLENVGQTDLFMSIRKDGKWSFPVNLGPKINTVGQEMFPNFIAGGLLSFSSNGQLINYGNLDIYYTTFPKIDKVRNIGGRINSQHDDFGLILEPNGNFGYFSSNRPGKGSDDIFRFDIERALIAQKNKIQDAAPILVASAEPVKKDSINKPNARIVNDINVLALNSKTEDSKKEIKNPIEIKQKEKEKPVISLPSISEKPIAVESPKNEIKNEKPDNKIIIAEPILKMDSTKLLVVSDKKELANKEKTEVAIKEPAKKENTNIIAPEVKKEIEPVIKYFELVIKDALSKKPLIGANVLCNNIVWITDAKGIVVIPENEMNNSILNISKNGYQNYIYAADATKYDDSKLQDVILLNAVESETVATINSIYYDFDKWNIKPEAKAVLDNLVSLMNKNNELKVELNSHADSRGSHSYNMILTEKRSNSAKGYITQKGISDNRLIAKNFGETQLVNECSDGVNCTEAQHALNRRTELKLVNGLTLPEISDAENRNDEASSNNRLVYSVQILALHKAPGVLPEKFRQDGKVSKKQIGGLAKFFIGEFDSYELAAAQKNNMKNLFKDAFIVAIRDGQIIQICDLKQNTKNENAIVLK